MHRARRGGQQKIIPFLRREGQVIILAARRTPLLPGVTLQQTCMAASRLWAVTQVIDSLRTRKNEAETSTFTLLLCLQKRVPWCPPTPNHRMPAPVTVFSRGGTPAIVFPHEVNAGYRTTQISLGSPRVFSTSKGGMGVGVIAFRRDGRDGRGACVPCPH